MRNLLLMQMTTHFDLPEGHRWAGVRKYTTNIGEHLNAAFQAVEDANRSGDNNFKINAK